MKTIYLLGMTLLVYISFGTLVDIFVASTTSRRILNIKTKVIFHNFLAPIMFASVIFIALFTGRTFVDIFFGLGILLGSLIRIFGSEGKYLTAFTIDNSLLTVTYLTKLLRCKSMQFDLADISNIQLEKANWLVDYPASVQITYKEDPVEFEIIHKKLKREVQKTVDAANMEFSAMLADE